MFPASKKEVWNKNLETKWMSMVNSVPGDKDFVLDTKMKCQKWFEGHQEVANSDEMRQVVANNAENFQKWAKLAGRPVTKIGNVNVLYQTLKIEKMRGFEG